MSITRLQQARQMYAMGQRVAKTLDGSRPGYRGSDYGDQAAGRGAYSGGDSSPAAGGTQGGGTGSGNQNTGSGSNDDRSSDTQQYNHNEAIERNTGIKNPLRPAGVDPGFIKPERADNLGFNLRPYEQQRVDFLNTPYKPVNIPLGVPGGMFINTVGNFLGGLGAKKNRQFFADNVAGKYGFGYGMDAYKDYMKQRMAGEVGAYGNENMGQNAINARAENAGGDGTQGIMGINIDNNVGDADGDGDVDQDDFIFKYFDKTGETLQAGAGGVENLMSSIKDRISNLFS